MRSLMKIDVLNINGKISVSPNIFVIPGHVKNQSFSVLLQHFQLFVIKETKTNIFHYLKFLKGKANRKQNKSIKDTLYYVNDLFISTKS